MRDLPRVSVTGRWQAGATRQPQSENMVKNRKGGRKAAEGSERANVAVDRPSVQQQQQGPAPTKRKRRTLPAKAMPTPRKTPAIAEAPQASQRAPPSDGYPWRMYGKKRVRRTDGSGRGRIMRAYYRCQMPGCKATKSIDERTDGAVVYKGEHNHGAVELLLRSDVKALAAEEPDSSQVTVCSLQDGDGVVWNKKQGGFRPHLRGFTFSRHLNAFVRAASAEPAVTAGGSSLATAAAALSGKQASGGASERRRVSAGRLSESSAPTMVTPPLQEKYRVRVSPLPAKPADGDGDDELVATSPAPPASRHASSEPEPSPPAPLQTMAAVVPQAALAPLWPTLAPPLAPSITAASYGSGYEQMCASLYAQTLPSMAPHQTLVGRVVGPAAFPAAAALSQPPPQLYSATGAAGGGSEPGRLAPVASAPMMPMMGWPLQAPWPQATWPLPQAPWTTPPSGVLPPWPLHSAAVGATALPAAALAPEPPPIMHCSG